ncbi:hypothetical protein ACLIA0_04055 [Bacillaceae bacterium W0354]
MSRRTLIISLVISFLGVSISPLFDSVTVTERSDLTNHRLGYPIPFVEQQASLTPLNDDYPFELGLLSPQEHSTKILFINYFISIILTALLIYLMIILFRLIIHKTLRSTHT